MDVYEVRDQMLGTEERWRKLRWLRLELVSYQDAAADIRRGHARVWETYTRFDAQTFKLLLGDVVTLLPAQDGLLRRLLAVPAEAGAINQLLDEAHAYDMTGAMARGGREQSYMTTIHRKLESFGEQCHAVERELERVVGPGF